MGKKQSLSIGTTTTIRQKQWISAVQRLLGPALEKTNNEFEDLVKQELDNNPALERVADNDNDINTKDEAGDEFTDTAESMQPTDDDDFENYRGKLKNARNSAADDDTTQREQAADVSLADYLTGQINERNLSARQQVIAEYVIGSVDDSGYLRRSAIDIADDITFNSGLNIEVEPSEVETVTAILRQLDPPGIGAADLRDCLLLQLRRKQSSAINGLAIKVLEECFDAFAKKNYQRVTRTLGLSDDELKRVMQVIARLNPKPGSAFGGSQSDSHGQQITPDFVVDIDDDDTITLTLVNSIPELQISESYDAQERYYKANTRPLSKHETDEAKLVKAQCFNAATFIEVVRRRQKTLFSTMDAIVRRQHDYVLSGDPADLKPMTLKYIAEETGLDMSVVSRACSGKYVQLPWGAKSLKSFFSEGIKKDGADGEVSSREVQSALKQIVDAEDKVAPLSDDALCDLLNARGYKIARRTVSKYRELLSIPTAKLRRKA